MKLIYLMKANVIYQIIFLDERVYILFLANVTMLEFSRLQNEPEFNILQQVIFLQAFSKKVFPED